MDIKAEKFINFVKDKGITDVKMYDAGDEMGSTIFQFPMMIAEQELMISVVTDKSIFVMVQIGVLRDAVKPGNKLAFLEKLNALNAQYKIFRYYADANNNLIMESCLPTTPDSFEPEMVGLALQLMVYNLKVEYPEFQKLQMSATVLREID